MNFLFMKIVSEGYSDNVTFGQRPEGSKGLGPGDVQEKRRSGRESSQCKCPEAESESGVFEKHQESQLEPRE